MVPVCTKFSVCFGSRAGVVCSRKQPLKPGTRRSSVRRGEGVEVQQGPLIHWSVVLASWTGNKFTAGRPHGLAAMIWGEDHNEF